MFVPNVLRLLGSSGRNISLNDASSAPTLGLFLIKPAKQYQLVIGSLTGKIPTDTDILSIGKDALWQERTFNTRAGFGSGQDRLPEFMATEPLSPNDTVFDVEDQDLDRVFGEYPKSC